ncbi:hypothetical protein [Paenibacillus sp. Leaf72]|uniref:hypothetical protein n=1 Tax=Paenibacillus sp. Leaf72 TaxID=1736234 RepID=UPI0006F27738|nr:hypothetical protein [Paenibacillus sp. Leaf72]KQN96899.1 hypothetical protein ASF12_22790 [Paenibacillus sp. Leaf72]
MEFKFTVLKNSEVLRFLDVFRQQELENILKEFNMNRAAIGKSKNTYLVINRDEPYAGEVIEIMKRNGHWGDLQNPVAESEGTPLKNDLSQMHTNLLHLEDSTKPRPLDEWHDDLGDVLWWFFPIQEPPYCGSPLDADWPDYHTHWTPIIIPSQPKVRKYTVAMDTNGSEEYMRAKYGDDCFTDNIGNAVLFDTLEELPELAAHEYVVYVEEDDDGGLSVAGKI